MIDVTMMSRRVESRCEPEDGRPGRLMMVLAWVEGRL
jgi:hypothetical protein